jgi:predicted transposase/invertase (TIGR01784 family)
MAVNREYENSVKVRDFAAETGDLENAIKKAITYCVEHDILKDFLETNASEVLDMLITERTTEKWGEVCWEEGREKGIEIGIEEGRKIAKLEMARNAFAKGLLIDVIRDITGLDTETLNSLSAK